MKMICIPQYQKLTQYRKQNGVVLMVTLMALLIMMLAGVALIRSTDTNLLIAGNMAFKRDLINQAERAIPQIQTLFKTGALKTATSRYTDNPVNNYYSTVLPSNDSGIPDKLATIVSAGTNKIYDSTSGVTIYYVIDRMCLSTGEIKSQSCTLAGNDSSDKCDDCQILATYFPVYRMTMKITGPRNTEAYLQTTYTDS